MVKQTERQINDRKKEGKKERRKEGKKERRKEGKKERRKEGKKEKKRGERKGGHMVRMTDRQWMVGQMDRQTE
jgi:hypothetical protein